MRVVSLNAKPQGLGFIHTGRFVWGEVDCCMSKCAGIEQVCGGYTNPRAAGQATRGSEYSVILM